MNDNKDIKKLLHKFILNQCNDREIEEVIFYFKKNNPSIEFPTVEDVLQMLTAVPKMEESSADEIYNKIIDVKKKQKSVRNTWKYVTATAIILISLVLNHFYQERVLMESQYEILLPNDESITLQLDNGDVEILSEKGTIQVLDSKGNIIGEQNDDQLVYSDEIVLEKLVYNTLTIPYGKRFKLQLSDGTTAHLNSGTTIKYPIKFLKGENRQVFLSGEAFFDVAKDAQHPFIVNADHLNVQVFGTQFNISVYPEDKVTDVVLVEGSVSLYTENINSNTTNDILLKPGYRGSLNRKENNISTEQVNTKIYTSWINGELIFRYMTFENILKKLERYYNVVITYESAELAHEEFNASFNNVPIEKILEYLKTTYDVDFTVTEGNNIKIE